MSAADTLVRARAAGIEVLASGGELRARGPTEALAQWAPALRPHRDELLALLTVEASARLPYWRLHFIDRDPLEVTFSPPVDHAEALRWYPAAVAAEPMADNEVQLEVLTHDER